MPVDRRDSLPSLGWTLLDWLGDFLPSPRDDSAPLTLTDEQALTLVRWYQVDPETGRFVYRRGYSRRSKGSGKSPIEAAKVIAELSGPVVFDGWDADGRPVGRPWGTGDLPPALVQVAACSQDQTGNVWSVVSTYLAANDGAAADALGLDPGLSRVVQRNGSGRAEPVTAAAGSREGQPLTYGSLDETMLWVASNGGIKLAAVLRRNLTKLDGRSYETTNEFVPGQDSVAEGTHKAIEKGAPGIFADDVEAPREVDGVPVTEDAPDETLRAALDAPYAGCWWVNLDRLVLDIRDPDTRWEDAARFFFNWNERSTAQFLDPVRWASLARRNGAPDNRTEIGLGFVGSISDSGTALYGCTREGFLFEVGAWERPSGADDWQVPRLEVHDAVAEAFKRWRVGRMFAAPATWRTELETWAARYGDKKVLALDTNQPTRFAPACDRFLTGVTDPDEALTHDGNEALAAHIAACAKKPVRISDDSDDARSRFVIVKADRRKIDRAVAAILAYEAARSMPAAAKPQVISMAAVLAADENRPRDD